MLAAATWAATPPALLETRAGVEIDWAEGTLTAGGGAAADLRMPNAAASRTGAVRRAEAAARAALRRALADLPLGGDRKLPAEAVERALGRARTTGTEVQSNGGALVRVTARFADWLPDVGAAAAPPAAILAAPAMRLAAAPLARLGTGAGAKELAFGAAVYRLGPASKGAASARAKLDRGGRLVLPEPGDADLTSKLARGVVVIYVEKVTR